MDILIPLIPAILALALAVLREVAPKTRTDIDDDILAKLSQLQPVQVAHLQRMLDSDYRTRFGPTPDDKGGL